MVRPSITKGTAWTTKTNFRAIDLFLFKEIWDSLSNGGRGGFQATVHANGVEWNTGNLPDNPDYYIGVDDLAVFITDNCAEVVALLTGAPSAKPKVKAKRVSSLRAGLPG